jgi:hypothetical protein
VKHAYTELPHLPRNVQNSEARYANATTVFENSASQEEANSNFQNTFEPGEILETHATAAQSITV